MAIRPILIHPDPRLRKKTEPVEHVDDSIRRLADDMLDTMYDAPGVGLAAPQVGSLKRIFVMDCNRDEPGKMPTVVINPEITWASDETAVAEEGCLSLPEIYDNVTRPTSIRMSFLDRDGARQEAEYDGLWAICAQHELDHLDGRLFIDYLGAIKRTLITNKMKKLKKERARG